MLARATPPSSLLISTHTSLSSDQTETTLPWRQPFLVVLTRPPRHRCHHTLAKIHCNSSVCCPTSCSESSFPLRPHTEGPEHHTGHLKPLRWMKPTNDPRTRRPALHSASARLLQLRVRLLRGNLICNDIEH